jgi:predicted FMN-binding regulatory protein PaiB
MQGRARAAMIANIQAFRLLIASVTGKLKLSQNRGAGDRRRVIAALARSEHPEAQATATWMQRFAAPDDA